jgi:NADPH:quinone reductase-like Zn-dependent oxidoreductase
MTRAIRFHEHGGPDVLRIEDIDMASPAPGEVQIRVRALGLNRAEAMLREGRYLARPPLPAGLGLEASGVVEAIGDGVTGIAVGDAVSVVPPISMVTWPAYGELANFPARLVVKHPSSLGWNGAAALWVANITAYGALIETAGLGAGDAVVITAASSSVGLAAIQIANIVGATPIAVTRTSAKRRALMEAGAANVIVSDEEDIELRLREIAGPGGVRVVFDAVGGPAFVPLTAAMARGGILIEYGGLSREPTPFPLASVMTKSLTLRGYVIYEIVNDDARLEKAKAFIIEALAQGSIRPIIDRVFPFNEIVAAHRYLESNEQFGKVVVTV